MVTTTFAGELPGYTDSAQLIRVEKSRGQIDAINSGLQPDCFYWYQKSVIDRVVNWFEATLGTPQKAGGDTLKDKNANR